MHRKKRPDSVTLAELGIRALPVHRRAKVTWRDSPVVFGVLALVAGIAMCTTTMTVGLLLAQ